MPQSTNTAKAESVMHPYPTGTCEFIKDNRTFQQVLEAAIGNESQLEMQKLCEFLQSTMDEPRLRRAGELSLAILLDDRLEAARHFRRGVVRRELSGEVSYSGQRDHDAHTLNNYILGFWFFDKVPAIKDEFEKHANRRGLLQLEDHSQKKERSRERAEVFGRLWKYVSLLHDVGYLFEGGLKELDPETQSRLAKLGANIVSDFFAATFWRECEEMTSTDARQRLMSLAGISSPAIIGSGIQALIDSMRRLGDLSDLTAQGPLPGELSSDAFDLWQQHYAKYEPPEESERRAKLTMAERIQRLERITYKLIESGIPDKGIRVLDHAVMGGLLQLLWRTTFFRLYHGVLRARSQANSMTVLDKAAIENFLKALGHRSGGAAGPAGASESDLYSAQTWWGGIVWASAATALHNIQQMDAGKLAKAFGNYYQLDKLALADDPLAYLGILVDILQEWDRYRVNPSLSDQGPIEGHRVWIGVDNKRILLAYPDGRAKTVEDGLNRSLTGWTQFVVIH